MVFMLKVTYDILYSQEKEPFVMEEPRVTSKGVEYVKLPN